MLQSLLYKSKILSNQAVLQQIPFRKAFFLLLILTCGDAFSQAPNITYTSPQVYINGAAISPLSPSNSGSAIPVKTFRTVSTYAGAGTAGGTNNVDPLVATFNDPRSVVMDARGNIYVAEFTDGRIRKIASNGTVSTIMTLSSSYNISGLAINSSTGNLYFSIDQHAVYRLSNTNSANYPGQDPTYASPTTGIISTYLLAGVYNSSGANEGAVGTGKLKNPRGLAIDAANANLYVADYGNNRIRKIVISSGMLSTVTTSINSPEDLVMDGSGELYVTSTNTRRVHKIATDLTVTNFAGSTSGTAGFVDGIGAAARFHEPRGIDMDGAGNLYVADGGNSGGTTGSYAIRKITPGGSVTTLAGSGTGDGNANTDGVGTAARFDLPWDVMVDRTNHALYVADEEGFRIRKLNVGGYTAWPGLSEGLSLAGTTGIISGTPTGRSRQVYYADDFEDGSAGAGTSTATQTSISNQIRLTDNTSDNQNGGFQVNSSGVNSTGLQVDFTMLISPNTSWDYGMSYSFSADGSVSGTSSGSQEQQGTGSGLSLSFTTASGKDPSVRLYYGRSSYSTATPALGTNGLLVINTSVNAQWRGVISRVSLIVDDLGRATVKINGSNVFTNVQLPAGYISANKSLWTHIFRGRTGAFDNNVYAIDDLVIRQQLGAADHTVTGFNASGSATATVNMNVVDLPVLTTTAVTAITATAASSGGEVTSDGGASVTARGVVWSTSPSPTVALSTKTTNGTGTGSFTSSVSGLSPETIYYLRAYATTAGGTAYGTERSFTTLPLAPSITYPSASYTFQVGTAVPAGVKLTNSGGTPDKVQVSTLAGKGNAGSADGNGTAATFFGPASVALDGSGNLYVADLYNHKIRKVTPTGVVTTLAGSTAGFQNGNLATAKFNYPNGVAVDNSGNILVADRDNNLIRKIDIGTGLVSTLAGTGVGGRANGLSTSATFNMPYGIVVDFSGNIYVSDRSNHQIRKIDPAGVVTTLAGTGSVGNVDGLTFNATFDLPNGVAMDGSRYLIVANERAHRIRRIDLVTAQVNTLAGSGDASSNDGTGTSASFNLPQGVAVDGAGNVYVAEYAGNVIRKITPTGVVSTLAGSSIAYGYADATGASAVFNRPIGIAVDASGSIIYVSDMVNNRIRILSNYRISPALPPGLFFDVRTGTISGTPTSPMAERVYTIYAQNASGEANIQLKIGIASPPTVVTGAATSVTASSATLAGTVNPNGNSTSSITISYATSQSVVDAGGGTAVTVSPTSASGNTVTPVSAAITGLDPSKTYYYRISATAAGITSNGNTLSFTTAAPVPNISYGSSSVSFSVGTPIAVLNLTNNGGAVEPVQVKTLAGSGSQGSTNGTSTAARFNKPTGVAVDGSGNLYVADRMNHSIRKIDIATGEVTTLAGSGSPGSSNGTGTGATFYFPSGVALDGSGNLYVADQYNHCIRKIVISTGVVTTLAGSGSSGSTNGRGNGASFFYPYGIAVDGTGSLYVADQYNNRIRRIVISSAEVTTLAGSGISGSVDGTGDGARFSYPVGVAVDGGGNLYVADHYNNRIRKIVISSGVVTTLAGSSISGSVDGKGTAASFKFPTGVAVDGNGNLYVADQSNHSIRKIVIATGEVTTVAGSGVYGTADGTGIGAGFDSPTGVAVDGSGSLYVAERMNNRIRAISNYSISPALPAGLSFNTVTGAITGTPTALSPATTYTITASNGGGVATTTISLEVSSPVLTADASSISQTTASSRGTVSGLSGVTDRGVIWSTSPNPTTALSTKTSDGSGSGTFTSSITGLSPNTTYYIRSYAVHSGGTEYGSQKTFKTNRTIAMSNQTKNFGDPAFFLTAPTSNSSGAWTFTSGTTSVATISGNTVMIVGAGTSTITATQAAVAPYASASTSFLLTVNGQTPTINLGIPTTTPLKDANGLFITPTSTSGGTVTLSLGAGSTTAALAASPGSYTLSAVNNTGDLIFQASVPTTGNYAAGTLTRTMSVTKNNPTITFTLLSSTVTYSNGLTQSLSATGGGSTEPVVFTVVSGPGTTSGTYGSTLNISGPGEIVIRASQAGDVNHNPAPDVVRTLTVNPAAPLITGFTPTSATEGDVVTITGSNFQNVTAVTFGATSAASFAVTSATTITAVLGTGHTGVVSVTTASGTVTEPGFRYKVTWTGATNAFNSTGNWSGGRVPQTDDDIIFSPTAASDLELDGNKTVGHVNFNGSGRSLKLGAHNLTIKGNLTMPGNITGTGRVIMNGASAQTIIGGGDIPDLEINNSNGVTIDASGEELAVSGTLRSTSGTLATNGKLRLKSNSSGTARVGNVAGSITGNVIAERYVKRNENSDGTGRAWRLVSVPVTGTGTLRDFFMNGRHGLDLTLTANRDAEADNSGTPIVGHNYATASEATTAGFDWIGVANQVSSLRSYVGDAGGGSFLSENVPSLSTSYDAAAQGYMVFTRGDRKLNLPSATSSGATTFRSTGSLKTGTQTVSVAPVSTSKFTLVGNPYMSVLDLSALYASNTTVIEPSFWIWVASMAGTNNQGGYVNVYLSGGQWVTNTGMYLDPQLIESGVAFFVEPVSSLSTATNINITEAHKSTASSVGMSPFATDQSDDHGRMYVRLERADAKGRRQLIDGVMADFHSSFKTTLGDQSDREKLRNGISRGALWLKTEQRILSSEGLPWPKEVKRSIPLYMSGVGDQTLIVRIDPRGMRDRYVKAWLKDNVLKRQIEINMNAPTDYDFIGTGSAVWDSTRFEIVYVEAGRPATGVTLDPDDAAEQPSVKLYPNPSKTADLKLSLRSMAPGSYTIQVLDMTGRLVATTALQHRSVNGEYRILEGRRLSPGTYVIRLSDQHKQLKETLRLMVD